MTPQTARQIRDLIVTGQLTAREVTMLALERIREDDVDLYSFLTVAEDHAMEQVDQLERRERAGELPGPLWGVPFSVKDTYNTAGLRTTYGSRVFADHVPDSDAEVVARVRRAGGILVGKTNTPEFAIYIRTKNDLAGETVNPWDLRRTTGGSSGGAAASVAAGITPIAIGSDGGGSVRIPAALCGVVGLMPSRGSTPRGGSHIGTRRFSAAGPMCLDAADASTLWRVMRGSDPTDPVWSQVHTTGLRRELHGRPPRMRWIGDSGVPGCEGDVITTVHAAATEMAAMAAVPLHEPALSIDAPRFAEAFYDIMQADRASTGGLALLADESKRTLLTSYSRHQFERGAKVTGAAYSAAIDVELDATAHLLSLLDDVDVVLTPTVGFIAPEIPVGDEALPEDARRGFVAFTFIMNYTGFPAATVPCGLVRGMPVGLQLIGRPGSEDVLLHLCEQFQRDIYRLTAPSAALRTVAPNDPTRVHS